MFIKTKDNQLINLDNIVAIYTLEYSNYCEVKANDDSEAMAYILGKFDTKELAERFIKDIAKGIEEEWRVMEVL